MSGQRILGFVLLVLGIVLLIVGLNASDSVADQLSNTFTGKFTDSTMWYILGGIALAVVGAITAFLPGGKGARA
jgi:succinate dehydrogenase/fumarate reductase cytochrome b subunit